MKILLLLVLFITTLPLQAKLTATVDRSQVVIGETLNLTITVDENTNAQPDLSQLQQVFQVLGNSQSSSTKIINGSYSIEKSWQIALMPNGVGDHTIPPITLGNELSKAIQVKVTKLDPNAKANGDIFIEISADKEIAFVKEQIILTVKLFYGINLSEGSLSEPIAKNTIVTQLDKGTTYTTNRDGRSYTVVERHYALFAEKSGQMELNPIIFNGRDNTSRRSFSMFSTGKPVRAVAKSMSFEIKPIPQNSIGTDWIPASKVQVSQQWSKEPFKVGEPITRTITLYIEGLSETQIPDINLGEINDVRVYPEQPQTQTEKTAQTLKTYKQVKLALIPTHEGAIRIPEYSLQWYNTNTGKTEYAKLPPMTIQVDAGEFALQKPEIKNILEPKTQKTSAVSSALKPEIKIIEKDNVLWKYFAALFAFLWLVTLVLYFKKPNEEKKKSTVEPIKKISKNQILYAIENRDIAELQTVLIYWWNQQYSKQQVTNLSQIKHYVSQPMQNLITEIELQLYKANDEQNFDKAQWSKLVKGKGLDRVKLVEKHLKKEKLPNLY